MTQLLSVHEFSKGLVTARPLLSDGLEGAFADGSRNQVQNGIGQTRPWLGLQSKGANTGGRKMFQIGSSWGSLRDISTLQGAGSFWEDIGKSRWLIGAGQPNYEGTDMAGITASTILQVAVAVAGVYSAGSTYDAGLPQPSAVDCAVLASPGVGFQGLTSGPVSFKIARFRATTGARSIASVTSAVVIPAKQSIRLTFPLASSGQTHWRVFATQEGFGGIGLHYALKYGIGTAAVLDIPESVVAAGTIDGIGRSLEFDYNTGDLVPELAYIDDYPPPAGTHAVRIENVMVVLGAIVDSTSSVSSTNTGTVGAVSLPNFYESYKPDHRVYFPEQIVDHRARLTDSYCYVALRNSIVALQYVGLRDGPAVALTTIIPDFGIAKPSNWCQVGGLLYMRIGNGTFVRMKSDGSLDYSWTAQIHDLVKNWDDTTVVEPHFDSMSVVISNSTQSYSFSLLTEDWFPACYFADAGVAGTALSAVHSRGELIMTIKNGSAQTAYAWDKGATKMWITSQAPYKRSMIEKVPRAVDIREMQVTFESDSFAAPLIIAISRNVRQTFVRDAVTNNASNSITSATLNLRRSRVGDMVCVFGTGVGGAGVDYLIGRIATSVQGSPSAITIIDAAGAPLNAGASLTGLYMTIAAQIFPYTFADIDAQHSAFLRQPIVLGCQSYAVGYSLLTAATSGQIHRAEISGNPHRGAVARVT